MNSPLGPVKTRVRASRFVTMSPIDLVFSAEAGDDIDSILAYTFDTWGSAQEVTSRLVLWNAFRRIQTFPEIGRLVSEDRDDLRERILEHHIILYRYHENTVTILRILNPRR